MVWKKMREKYYYRWTIKQDTGFIKIRLFSICPYGLYLSFSLYPEQELSLSFDRTDIFMRLYLGDCFPDMLLLCLNSVVNRQETPKILG